MYIVAIAWLYITILMAAAETSITAGVLTFVFYGLAPLALLLWLFGTPIRRRAKLKAEKTENAGATGLADKTVGNVMGNEDRAHTKDD